MAQRQETETKRLLASNRRARHQFHVLETYEAGLSLLGTEVKSIRAGKIQLREAFVEIKNGEAWLLGAHVSPYSHGNRENHDPERARKLLLKRREIDRLYGRLQVKGQTVIPLSVYLKGHRIKIELGVVQGKKLHDKREAERKRTLDREVEEALASRHRS